MNKLLSLCFLLPILFSCEQRLQQDNQAIVSAIFGGSAVGAQEWRSTVAIDLNDEGTDHCSGVLISKNEVLTAAHCITSIETLDDFATGKTNFTNLKVHIGNGSSEAYSGSYRIAEIKVHPYYNKGKYNRYDFAYIKLSKSIDGVTIVPPATFSEMDQVAKHDQEVTLVGFGKRENGKIGEKYQVNASINWQVKSELMAGGNGKSSCSGDSGGPLFVRLSSGEYRLLGITSRGETNVFGSPQCEKEAVYGKVPFAMKWLEAEKYLKIAESNYFNSEWVLHNLNKVIQLLPRYGKAYFKRGLLYKKLKMEAAAVEDFYKVLHLDPRSGGEVVDLLKELTGEEGRQNFYLNRGIGNLNQQEFDFAFSDLEKALALGATSTIYYYLGELFALKYEADYDQALEYYNQAIGNFSDDASIYFSRANIYIVKKDYTAALDDLENAIKLKPDFGQAYFNLGHLYVLLENENLAKESLEKAIELQANVDGTDLIGLSTTMLVCSKGYYSLLSLLIGAGANVNVEGYFRESPLTKMVQTGTFDLVSMVIGAGGKLDHFDEYGYTALHLAAYRGDLDIVRLLVKEGAEVGAKTKYGQTPLDIAKTRNYDHLVAYFETLNIN